MRPGAQVLVAGGSGLVGTNLTRRLVQSGAEVLSTFASRQPAEFPEVYRAFDFTRWEDCLEATRDRDCVFYVRRSDRRSGHDARTSHGIHSAESANQCGTA